MKPVLHIWMRMRWTDAVDGNGVVVGVGDVDTTEPGTYQLIYNYTDAAGNASSDPND